MKVGKPVLGAVLVVGCVYAVYPYVTLYRLGQAVRQGDAAELETMIDWASVREGIKEDICDQVADEPQPAQSDGKLPPFGSGFVRGIATNSVDKRVTPEALVAATQQPGAPPTIGGPSLQVNWAFFISASTFVVDLSSSGQPTPIRMQMDLHSGAWRVTRVWLPPELLGQNKTGT